MRLAHMLVGLGALALACRPASVTTGTIDVSTFARCSGTVDDTAAVQEALRAAAGGTLRVPAGCRLLVRSPGAGGVSFVLPSGTHVVCEGSTGFELARRRCEGGGYPGAACASDAECLGGGACRIDGGLAGPYAPDADAVYTLFRAATGSRDVAVSGCRIRVYGSDAFFRCVGGTHDGAPCEQYCSGDGPLANLGCSDDAACGTGNTCVGRADCTGAGGTCAAESGLPAGPGRINVLDLAGTTDAVVERNSIYDHRRGELSIAVGSGAVVTDNDTNTTIDTHITSFFGAGPSNTIAVDSALVAAERARVRGNVLRGAVAVVRVGGFSVVSDNALTGSGPTTTGIYLRGQHPRIIGNQVRAYRCVQGDPLHLSNVTIVGNRCLGGKGAKIVVTGAGWTVNDNYLAWGSGAERNGEPVVWIGSQDRVGAAVTHPVLSGNLIFSDQPGASLIRFADPGNRCTDGPQRGTTCARDADCSPGRCAPSQHMDAIITGNIFVRGAPGQIAIDLGMGGSPTGDTGVTGLAITANQFAGVDVGIRFPTDAAVVHDTNVVGNSFGEKVRAPIESFSWTSGTVLDNAGLGPSNDAVTLVWLTNGDADPAVPGDAVEVDPAMDAAFRRARAATPVGVVLDAPVPGAVGKIAVRGTTTCNLDGTPVARGSRLARSATPGKLHAALSGEQPLATALGEGSARVRCLLRD